MEKVFDNIKFETRNCPICLKPDGSTVKFQSSVDLSKINEFGFASRKIPEFMRFRLLECNLCKLLFASPVPSEEVIYSLYRDASFDSGNEAAFAAKTYTNVLKSVRNLLPDFERSLDIGTGDGIFMDCMLDFGFKDVQGVEPSKAPVESASVRVRDKIQVKLFDGSDYVEDSFSMVSCFQTMEHVYHPLLMTKEIVRILKPGGLAFFVGHNRKSILNRLLGTRSPIFDVEHLQLFSPESALKLFREAGLENVSVLPIHNKYPLGYWVKLLPIPLVVKNYLLKSLIFLKISKWAISATVGNQAIFGQKPSVNN